MDYQSSRRRLGFCPRNLLESSISSTLRRPGLAHRSDGLRSSHTNSSASGRGCGLPDTGRGPYANSDIRIARPLLTFHDNESVLQRAQRQASGYPSLVVVVESDGTAAAACPPDRPVLAEVAVVLGPQLILGTVAVVVAVERLASIVGRIVLCKSFDNVELDEWVLGEAVKSEVGVAGGVVFRSVVDDTALVLADMLSRSGGGRTGSGFLCSPCQRQSCLPDRAPSLE